MLNIIDRSNSMPTDGNNRIRNSTGKGVDKIEKQTLRKFKKNSQQEDLFN